MNHTHAHIMKGRLESVGITFKKLEHLRWASYDGDDEILFARTLGECIWKTAKEMGE